MPFSWPICCESEAILSKKFRPGYPGRNLFIWGNFHPGQPEILVAKSEILVTGPACLFIWTRRIFYEGKRGEAALYEVVGHFTLLFWRGKLRNVQIFIYNVRAQSFFLGRVVRKPVNVNPGLNVFWRIVFSCLKMFLTSNIWCSLRLLQLITEGQTI